MNTFHRTTMKALAFSASAIAFTTAVPALAQDGEPGEECLDNNVPGIINAEGECVTTQEGPTGTTTGQGEEVEIATGASGETELRFGRYLSETVYTDLQIDSGGNTEASVNIDLTPSVTARGSVESAGDSSIGVFFERDY